MGKRHPLTGRPHPLVAAALPNAKPDSASSCTSMPPPLKRAFDPDVYYDDWLEEQNRLRQASAQPRQSDHQPRRASQSRPDANRPKSGASRSQSYTASYEEWVSDAEYKALQPRLEKYKSATVYMQRAAACMRRRDTLERQARRECEEGTMTAAKAAIIKQQAAYEQLKYGKAMTAFKAKVRYINATSDITGGRVTALPDDAASMTSTQSSAASNQARRASNAPTASQDIHPLPLPQPPIAPSSATVQESKHHRLSSIFHRSHRTARVSEIL